MVLKRENSQIKEILKGNTKKLKKDNLATQYRNIRNCFFNFVNLSIKNDFKKIYCFSNRC